MRRRLAGIVAALATAATLWAQVPAAPAAVAKTPPPPASLATNTIDAHLGYMPQSTCTPSAKPGTKALLTLLIATWGGGSSGISRACSVGATSEHKEGRALDWHMDMKYAGQRKRVNQALAWLTANNGEVAYRLGVMYVIWNQRIWSVYYPQLGWRKMASRGSYTANHKNHVHISLSWDGAMKQTSWWTGVPITQPLNSRCGVGGARACLPTIDRTSKSWPYQQTDVPASFLPAPWTKPGIGGDPQVDRTLTVVPGTWVPEGAPLAYQWTDGSSDIPGATGETFVITPDLVGRPIRVRVTATTDAGVLTKTSDETEEVLRAWFGDTPKPGIAGTAATDQTVTVDTGAWTPAPDTLTITWKRNGKAIAGASGTDATSYTLTPSDTGHKLTVTLTARRAGYTTTSVTSAAVRVAAAPFADAPKPTLPAEAVAGVALTADPGTWTPVPSALRYQWYVAGTKVKGATKASYTPGTRQVGKPVQVRVKATRAGYVTTYVRSDPVTITAAP